MEIKTLNVVMIATHRSNIYLHNNKIYNSKTSMHIPDGNQITQHLYFTSDNEIKENEYYVNGKYLYLANKNYKKAENDRKIEATTDTKFYAKPGNDGEIYGMMKGGIPSISQLFVQSYIKAYNEGNPILTVEVEKEIINTEPKLYNIEEMKLAFECGRNFQVTGENNLEEIL